MAEKQLPSGFAAWFIEFYKRFGLKTPKFFQVLQIVGIIAAIVGFIPDALQYLEVTTTPIIDRYVSLAVKVAGGITWLISKLPAVNANTVAFHSNSLPFTEKKKIEGKEPTPATTAALLTGEENTLPKFESNLQTPKKPTE